MTKATVTCNLLIRGEPSVKANRLGVYQSGDEINITDVVLGLSKQDYYEGVPSWYLLANGTYVWSGGVSMDVEEKVFIKKLELDSEVAKDDNAIDLVKLLNFPSIPDGTGKGVRVAVLDSGIMDIAGIKVNRQYSKDFINKGKIHAHGTWVAGIIGANSKVITGLAKEAEILDLRVVNSYGSTKDRRLLDALDYLIKLNDVEGEKCHIVNMSLDILSGTVEYIKPKIKALQDKGTLVVAAGVNSYGDMTEISKSGKLICVGVYSKGNFESVKKNGFAPSISCSFQNNKIPSVNTQAGNSLGDSSGYTALISGYIARMLSSGVKPEKVQANLKKNLRSISSEKKSTPYKPYKS
ncbi:S8 family serine peptidase [Fulvivirga sp. 29W222]|uniref:S8 family serine peptidase n=1 Tax=Fulvivirga marina TaxID=2494733 RepID=A0A937KBL5_9BACT|nr:S8 family serine peptidase [Fulvivirga marina]MBL6446372.1 S8 family serine peptidase [Fulvivirga marina]